MGLVLRRHTEALHELTPQEFREMSELLARTAQILREVTGCEKEYALCLAEAEHFKHIHVHVIAKPADLPAEARGARVFSLLKPTEQEPVPPEEIEAFCVLLRERFTRTKAVPLMS